MYIYCNVWNTVYNYNIGPIKFEPHSNIHIYYALSPIQNATHKNIW